MFKRTFAVLLVATLNIGLVCAQDRPMTLDELYQLAEQNSQSIKVARTAVESAKEGIADAKSQRLPSLNTSVSVGYLGDGLLSDRDFTGWMHVTNPHFMNSFAFQAQQVVYSGGALTSGIRMAEMGEQMATLSWQKNRQEIRFLITGYYLDLCKLQNQQQVIEKNIALVDEVLRNMEARRKEGTALKNDITRYELQREALKLQREKVIDAQKIMSHQICVTLHVASPGPSKGGVLMVSTAGLADANSNVLSETDWQQIAAQNNIGLQQTQLSVKMADEKVKLAKSAQLPKVSVIAEDHFNGPITTTVPVTNKNIQYWFAGVGVSYELSSLFKSNKKIRKAKIDLRNSQEQHELAQEGVNMAIQAAYTNYLTAYTELQTEKKSVELAEQNYSVTSNRYKNGLALLTDMLDASNTKLSADLALVNANINILYNYYKLKYITHTL